MDGVKRTIEMTVSSTKNSKILVILKEAIVRPLFKDRQHIIIFLHKQALQRTVFPCKPTQRITLVVVKHLQHILESSKVLLLLISLMFGLQ